MRERESLGRQHLEQENNNDLLRCAAKVGLSRDLIPRSGTPVAERLINLCFEYAAAAEDNNAGKYGSDHKRRKIHNELCLLLLGRPWADLSYTDREKISDFAVIVAGHDNLIGTF